MPFTWIDHVFSHSDVADPAVSPISTTQSHGRKTHGTVSAAPPNKEFHVLQFLGHSPKKGILLLSIKAFPYLSLSLSLFVNIIFWLNLNSTLSVHSFPGVAHRPHHRVRPPSIAVPPSSSSFKHHEKKHVHGSASSPTTSFYRHYHARDKFRNSAPAPSSLLSPHPYNQQGKDFLNV